jgi:hypothetical protein
VHYYKCFSHHPSATDYELGHAENGAELLPEQIRISDRKGKRTLEIYQPLNGLSNEIRLSPTTYKDTWAGRLRLNGSPDSLAIVKQKRKGALTVSVFPGTFPKSAQDIATLITE